MSASKSSHTTHEPDSDLFNTPVDLICPITQDLFHHPVLNSLGMVYEREAITAYMRERVSDPVTNMPLPSNTLTPVFPIKSRAMEYRERSAKLCVQKACSGASEGAPPTEPVKYVRRAAELCAKAEFQVPGLSRETIEYLNAHASNARSGFRQEAANVYMRILESSEGDKELQTRALQQWMRCWFPPSTAQDDSDVEELHDQNWDEELVPRLATFMTAQHMFTAAQFVDIMVEASLPEDLVLQLIEHLLAQVEEHSGAKSLSVASCQSQLLLKYTQLKCKQVSRQASSALGTSAGGQSGYEVRMSERHRQLPGWARFLGHHRRSLSKAAFLAASLLAKSSLLVRALKASTTPAAGDPLLRIATSQQVSCGLAALRARLKQTTSGMGSVQHYKTFALSELIFPFFV
eukprot:gene21944-28990_t